MVAIAVISLPQLGHGAEFALSNRAGCLASLSGQIEKGDAAKFSDFAAEHPTLASSGLVEDNSEKALCLNSPGGSFLEARTISAEVFDKGIATRVDAGASCLSACAVIFMAGRAISHESDGPSRILNVSGVLGFHAPYVRVDPEAQIIGANVNDFILQQNQMIADFIRFASYRSVFHYRPSISLGLLTEMLAMPPDGMFLIDTVERAARWGISIDGMRLAEQVDEQMLLQACVNEFAWLYDSPSEFLAKGSSSDWSATHVRRKVYIDSYRFLDFSSETLSHRVCRIEFPSTPTGGMLVCLEDGFTGVALGNCTDVDLPYAEWIPWWHAMPPEIPLIELAD